MMKQQEWSISCLKQKIESLKAEKDQMNLVLDVRAAPFTPPVKGKCHPFEMFQKTLTSLDTLETYQESNFLSSPLATSTVL